MIDTLQVAFDIIVIGGSAVLVVLGFIAGLAYIAWKSGW